MKNPTVVYMIAYDEQVVLDDSADYDFRTFVSHNLGVFLNESKAKLECVGLNAERLGDDDDVETAEDYYYVLPVDVKDAKPKQTRWWSKAHQEEKIKAADAINPNRNDAFYKGV